MRSQIIVLAVTLGLAGTLAVPARGDETLQQRSERSFDASGIETVRVDNARGRVIVSRSPDARVHLTALKIVRTGDSRESERIAARLEVTTRVSDGALEVRAGYPRGTSVHVSFWDLLRGYELPRVEVRLKLAVPDRMSVRVRTSSGDVQTEDLGGAQALTSVSGDVTVAGARGALEVSSTSGDIEAAGLAAVRLKSTSGDIRVRDAGGPLRVTSTSGDVRVTGARDSLDLETTSGDVRVSEAPRGARIRSTSGRVVLGRASRSVRIEGSSADVDLELDGRLERVDVRTGSGSITAWVAGALGCRLDLRTSSGSLDVTVPLQLIQATRHEVRGVIGDGSAPVTLRTSSGDIDVRGKRI